MQFLGLVIFDLTVCKCASCILKMHRLRKKCNIRLFFITCCTRAERRDRRSTNVCLNKHFLAVGLAALWGMLFLFFNYVEQAQETVKNANMFSKSLHQLFLELQVLGSILEPGSVSDTFCHMYLFHNAHAIDPLKIKSKKL